MFSPDPGFKLGFDTISAEDTPGRAFCHTLHMSRETIKAQPSGMIGSNGTMTFVMRDGSKR